jgi:hypothetical protein
MIDPRKAGLIGYREDHTLLNKGSGVGRGVSPQDGFSRPPPKQLQDKNARASSRATGVCL